MDTSNQYTAAGNPKMGCRLRFFVQLTDFPQDSFPNGWYNQIRKELIIL